MVRRCHVAFGPSCERMARPAGSGAATLKRGQVGTLGRRSASKGTGG